MLFFIIFRAHSERYPDGRGIAFIFNTSLKPFKIFEITQFWCFCFNFFQNEYVFAIKQARRREHDIAIVNAAMRVLLGKQTKCSSWQIKDCSFSFGGMALTTVMAVKTMKSLTGR